MLEVPGPVTLPPGVINPSRLRSRALLYFQTAHRQPSPWVPDFNSVGVKGDTALVDPFRGWDRLEIRHNGRTEPAGLPPGSLEALQDAGVRHVVLDRKELGEARTRRLEQALEAGGAVPSAADDRRVLLTLPPLPQGDRPPP